MKRFKTQLTLGWRPVARLSAAAVAVAAAMSLAACGSSGAGSGSGGGEVDTSVLSIGYDSDPVPSEYDPLHYSAGQRLFYESLYESLFTLTPEGEAEPDLVSEYSYSEDNTELTLTLRDDVTFRDGSTLDAELVKANLDRRNNPELPSYGAFADGEEAEITDVEVQDESTVVLSFAAPQATFHLQLAGVPGMIIGPEGIADPASLSTRPDGSGPYSLDTGATTKGSSYALTKKDNHPDADEHAWESLTYKVFTDAQARANALVSGQVNVAILAGNTVDLVESRGMNVASNGGSVFTVTVFDKKGITSEPFGDVRVRQAILHAIDREEIVNSLHEGDQPTSNAFPSAAPGYDESLNEEFGYDPERARELLADAGYADGFSFPQITDPQNMTDMQAIQAQLAEVGIDMKLRPASSTEERFASVRTHPMGAILLGWGDPLGTVQGVVVGGFMNFQGASDPQITEALRSAAAATGDERDAALTDLNRALVERGWLIPVYESFAHTGYDPDKVAKVGFAGTEAYPLLQALQPAA